LSADDIVVGLALARPFDAWRAEVVFRWRHFGN
jgi:hypothetical protein